MILDIENEAISSVTDVDKMRVMYDKGVRAEHFNDPVNASAMMWATEYFVNSGFRHAPTKQSILSEFPSLELKVPEESLTWICSEMKKRYLSSGAGNAIVEASEIVHDDPERAVAFLQETMWRLSNNTDDRTSTSNIKNNVEARKVRMLEREEANRNNEIVGARTGFYEIDKHTGGLLDGELAAVAGFAKAGKTWIGLNVAVSASKAGKRAMFVTLELSIEEIEDRLDAMMSGVSYARLQSGALSKSEKSDLNDYYDKIDEYGDILVEQPPVGKRTVPHVVRRARESGADVLIIDQMSFMENTKGQPIIELQEYRNIVSDLKREISRRDERRIPCYLLAQMNRASIGTRNGRGDMSTLASTSELERTADIVYGISKTRQEALHSKSTLEILGARRLDRKAWLITTELRERTEFSVVMEREDDED